MFKLGVDSDLGISYKRHGFGSKVRVTVKVNNLTAIRRGFELYECLIVVVALLRAIEQCTKLCFYTCSYSSDA